MMFDMDVKQPLNLFLPDVTLDNEIYINGFSLDSRRINKDEVFIALKGRKYNGIRYIDDAIARGANCILVEDEVTQIYPVPVIKINDLKNKIANIVAKFYQDPSKKLNLIGVTGTNGKSTIVYLLSFILSNLGEKTAQIGTLGFGSWRDLIESDLTTPDVIQLQKNLSGLLGSGHKTVAMEVSSIGIAEKRVGMLDFNVGIFTNLSPEHLDYHQNMYSYGRAKQKLFTDFNLELAILNTDDPFGSQLKEMISGNTEVVTYGMTKADFCINKITNTKEGMELDIKTPKGDQRLITNLMGKFNIYNLLALLAYVEFKGLSSNNCLKLIENLPAIPGRMQLISNPGNIRIFVDFAHTPDAIANALMALKSCSNGKLICVFGCGGERDQYKRAKMGKIASEIADLVYITDDNPRGEDPKDIVNDILSGIIRKDKIKVIHDRADAIYQAISLATFQDVMLIAGKGHENYQIYHDHQEPFDDVKVVREILNEL